MILFGNDNSATELKYFFSVFFVSLIIYIPLFVGVLVDPLRRQQGEPENVAERSVRLVERDKQGTAA